MSKNPRSIVISYRINPIVIAKALDGLKQYDKTTAPYSLGGICKLSMLHGVNYLTQGLPAEPSEESKRFVQSLTTQGNGKPNLSIEQIIGSELKFPKSIQAEPEDWGTTAVKTIITDWRITPDMREEEEKEE